MAIVAAAQMESTGDLNENFQQIENLVQEAIHKKAIMVVLPEDCLTLGMENNEKLKASQDKTLVPKMAEIARKYKIWLVAGSIPIYERDKLFYSTLFVFDDSGEIKAQYQKIHLFDAKVHGKEYNESKTVLPGHNVCVSTSPLGKMGLSICYDVRFPELYRNMVSLGAEIFLIPSAFTPETGDEHWHLLVQARAVENMCYVIAAGQDGKRANGEGTYGHTIIVGPWGEILAEKEKGQGIITAEIDQKYLENVRMNFPSLQHKRL